MKVLIHTFTTPGFIPWLETLLESVKISSGGSIDVRVDSVNLSGEEIAHIENLYDRASVHNINTDFRSLSEDMGLPEETLHRWKREIEDGNTSKTNFPYKIYISVNQRYRKMDKVIEESRQAGYDLLVHCDADVMFRSEMSESGLVRRMQDYDVAFYVNKGKRNMMQHARKVFGAFLVFNLKGNLDEFVDTWMGEIDRVPFLDRWKGFGQSVLFYTWNRVEETKTLDLFSVAEDFKMSRNFEQDADVWFGSNNFNQIIRLRRHLKISGLMSKADMTRYLYKKDLSQLARHAGLPDPYAATAGDDGGKEMAK